jgi:hypothetical protein
MKINRQLHLTQSIETDSGTIHIHSMPISVETWRNYFLILAKTYSQIFSQGLHTISGPIVAGLMLERLARADSVWDGPEGVQNGLLPEIRRLTNVIVPTGKGWETLPYEEALRRGLISGDDVEEVEGALVFFICASAVLRGPKQRRKLEILLGMVEYQWGARSSLLGLTEFAASLQTLTPDATIGEKRPESSLPH